MYIYHLLRKFTQKVFFQFFSLYNSNAVTGEIMLSETAPTTQLGGTVSVLLWPMLDTPYTDLQMAILDPTSRAKQPNGINQKNR